MKGGILEVLLVSAEGLRHPSFFGNMGYYVIVQCGKEIHRSKTTSAKGHKAWWNEKLVFQIPFSEYRESCHLSLTIMDKHIFNEDDFFGETMVHLEGIMREGKEKGQLEVKPERYNVVGEDGTYEGAIKIGLKFIHNVEVPEIRAKEAAEETKQSQPLMTSIFNFMRFSWLRCYFSHEP